MKNLIGKEESVMRAMESYFGDDVRRIDHAKRVTAFAEELLNKEGGRRDVIISAAILHDIGIHECERKHGSTDGQLQEKEGVPVAKKILAECGVGDDVISEVCRIIASHHSPGEIDTVEFSIMWDADWLVNLGDECDVSDAEKTRKLIEKVFLTDAGRAKAKEIYCGEGKR